MSNNNSSNINNIYIFLNEGLSEVMQSLINPTRSNPRPINIIRLDNNNFNNFDINGFNNAFNNLDNKSSYYFNNNNCNNNIFNCRYNAPKSYIDGNLHNYFQNIPKKIIPAEINRQSQNNNNIFKSKYNVPKKFQRRKSFLLFPKSPKTNKSY